MQRDTGFGCLGRAEEEKLKDTEEKYVWKWSMYVCIHSISPPYPPRNKFYHSGLRFKEMEGLLETKGFILFLGLGMWRA